MTWGKVKFDFWNNPKVIASGLHGGLAFQAAVLMRAWRNRPGVLPPAESTPAALQALLHGTGLTVKQVTQGIALACVHGLLERLPDGSLRLCGWNPEEWGNPKGGAERTAKWREQRGAAVQGGADGDPPMGFSRHPTAQGSVTARDVTVTSPRRRPASRGDAPVTAGDVSRRHNVTDCDALRVQSTEEEYVPVPTTIPTSTSTPRARATTGVVVVSNGEQEELHARLTREGMVSVQARVRALETLRTFESPVQVLDRAIGHARRHGREVPALLASILADPDSLRAVLAQLANSTQHAAQAEAVDRLTGGAAAPAPRESLRPPREMTQQERLLDLKRRFAERDERGESAP